MVNIFFFLGYDWTVKVIKMLHDVTSPEKIFGVGVSLKKKDTTTIYILFRLREVCIFFMNTKVTY